MGTVPRSVGDPDMASGGSAEERRVLSTDLEHHLADCALLVGRVPASGAECEAASAVALYYHRGRGSESDQVLPPPRESPKLGLPSPWTRNRRHSRVRMR